MQRYFNNVTTANGDAVSGISVTVRDADGALATIYSDDGVTEQDNPMLTSATGTFGFYAADGTYTLEFAGPRIGQQSETISLETAAAVADYDGLRAFPGRSQTVNVTGYLATAAPSGVAGIFTVDDSDTTTADNGGTVIVASNGKRWKRVYEGRMNVRWFGAVGDGATDDTQAIAAGVSASVVSCRILFFPAGTYKVTDTISIPSYTQLQGEHWNMNPKSFSVQPRGTKILFQPASAKSLFVASGTPPFGSFRSSYCIEGFHIEGNSTSSAGNSIYALDIDQIVRSRFSNLAIQGFRYGIRCDATINNRFEFVYIGTCYIADVLYDGGNATTDVWDQCYLNTAPIGVQTSGTSLGIRWSNCIFESFDNYGVNLVKEVYGWQFMDCYAEDVPGTNNANGCMFRVGYDGSALIGSPQLIVSGGYYGGRNAGAVGAMLDVDYTDGVIIGSFHASRFTNVVKTSANTQTNQVAILGYSSASITTQISDLTKVSGVYASSTYNSGTRMEQRLKAGLIICPVLRANTTSTGTIAVQADGVQVNCDISPDADNTAGRELGSAALRFPDVFSVNFRPGAGTATWTSGAGSPEGVVTATVGSLYTRTDGGPGTTLYVKESGTGNTGWVAVGYTAGGSVTQITNKTTGVTLNNRRGQITMEATANIAAGAVAAFTLTNSTIGANDTVVVHRKSGGTASSYRVWCDSVAAGSCVICVENRTAGALAEGVVLQFSVLNGAVA